MFGTCFSRIVVLSLWWICGLLSIIRARQDSSMALYMVSSTACFSGTQAGSISARALPTDIVQPFDPESIVPTVLKITVTTPGCANTNSSMMSSSSGLWLSMCRVADSTSGPQAGSTAMS